MKSVKEEREITRELVSSSGRTYTASISPRAYVRLLVVLGHVPISALP